MTQTFNIGRHRVGDGERTFVIAEVGSNHDKDFDQARRLIDAAALAGADCVKFQLFSARELYPQGGDLYDIIKSLETPREWVPALTEQAGAQGMEFLASPFDLSAVDVLASANAPAYKIASSEATNLPLIGRAAAHGKPMLISTGMCDLADVQEAIDVVRGAGNEHILLLQCAALYPAEPSQVHLRTMDTLRNAFQCPVGFSDHTLGLSVPTAAVARGACVIEKHFTLDKKGKGPDHFYALEPAEFTAMVAAIRDAEASLGSGEKRMLPEESREARRESLRAARDLDAGAVLSAADIATARPADGVRPRLAGAFVGRRLTRGLRKGQTLTWEALER